MTSKPFDAETYVDAAAAALNLAIAPEHRPGVVVNFERLAAMAQLVMEFHGVDGIEPAPVFRA